MLKNKEAANWGKSNRLISARTASPRDRSTRCFDNYGQSDRMAIDTDQRHELRRPYWCFRNRKAAHGDETKRFTALRKKDRRSISRAQSALTCCSTHSSRRGFVARASLSSRRTAWHTHPLGQTLIVTFGTGWVHRWGGPVEEIRPGDVVWFERGEKHWRDAHDGDDAYRGSGGAER
jgi:mannose-6-phosphate isomerase-like protein (cupin superfamily)